MNRKEITDEFVLLLPEPDYELHYNSAPFSPWADGLLRHADAGLGWDLHVRLLKVLVAAGIHDNHRNRLVLHHVEKFLGCDPTSRHHSYQIKSPNQHETNNCKNYNYQIKHNGKKMYLWCYSSYLSELYSSVHSVLLPVDGETIILLINTDFRLIPSDLISSYIKQP